MGLQICAADFLVPRRRLFPARPPMRPTARSRRCSSGCVAAASKGKQTSWEHTSLSGEFYSSLILGNLIDEYNDTALADRLFVIDPAKKSHRIIAGLKSCDWYKQNPALELLSQVRTSLIWRIQ